MPHFRSVEPMVRVGGRTAQLDLVCGSGVTVQVSVPVPASMRQMSAEEVEDAVWRTAVTALEAAVAQLRRSATR